VLEDPGGIPLAQLLGQTSDLGSSLRRATELANAISHLYRCGIVHKDIKFANVLMNSFTEKVWLMRFGIASRLSREHRPPAAPEFIAGTLAYMAPEQTGRMNRSTDSRSDLYSYGVIASRKCSRAHFNSTRLTSWGWSTATSPEGQCRRMRGLAVSHQQFHPS
jgi:serine/threonine protein kinase